MFMSRHLNCGGRARSSNQRVNKINMTIIQFGTYINSIEKNHAYHVHKKNYYASKSFMVFTNFFKKWMKNVQPFPIQLHFFTKPTDKH